jgi:co-chaperonin GroES (HSP10)
MSKKITINKINDIKHLVKEDTLIVFAVEKDKKYLPLAYSPSPYEEGVVVLMGPESKPSVTEVKPSVPEVKPSVPEVKSGVKNQENPTNLSYKIQIKDKILFDNSNGLILEINNSKDKYFIINKKDIFFILG